MKNTTVIIFMLLVAICSAARFPFQRRVDAGFCADCAGFRHDCHCVEFNLCKDNCPSTGECRAAGCNKKKPDGWKRTFPLHKALFQRSEEAGVCEGCAQMVGGCPCHHIDYCKDEGCGIGSCSKGNCENY